MLTISDKIMNKLINNLGEIIRWPKKPHEKEINGIIDKYHLFNDIPPLRRELVSRKFFAREDDGSVYWKIN